MSNYDLQLFQCKATTYRGGLAIVVMRQLTRGFFFLGMRGFFLKNAWHFKDIFREFEASLK
jgi:hypothetical protein